MNPQSLLALEPIQIPSYTLRNITISPGLVLAPMSGVTCVAFRRLFKELNGKHLGLVVTEFISVEALTRKVARSFEMMRYREFERPLCIQIFGYDIQRMQEGAQMAQDAGADIIDINCGCPAPKVVRRGGGCELMRQPDHLAKIVKAVRSVVKVPLTLKMRSGWDANSLNAKEIALAVEAEGIEALAIHGRTRAQLYRGDADWDVVWRVCEAVSIPVLGSGDVVDYATLKLKLTPPEWYQSSKRLAGVLIGRGAIANPLIFHDFATNTDSQLRHNEARMIQILLRYCEFLDEDFKEKARVGKLKQLASQMVRGYEWRKDFLRVNSYQQQYDTLRTLRDRAMGTQSISLQQSTNSQELSSC